MKKTKEKKIIAPNECSFIRWILVLGFSALFLFVMPLFSAYAKSEATFMGIKHLDLYNTFLFIPLYVGFVIGLRLIAKTTVKQFVFGVNGKFDKKVAFTLLGLFVAGMVIVHLIVIKNITWRGVELGQYLFLVVTMLLTIWMQTTFEEFVFRGLILRWICKNDLRYSKKTIIAALVTSFVFAVAHIGNPEIAAQSGFDIVIILTGYFIYGAVAFWADIHFGSLLPGIVIHWANNFIIATIISQKVSAATYPTLFIDNTPKIASWDCISIILAHLPIVVYMIIDLIKKKKAATTNAL